MYLTSHSKIMCVSFLAGIAYLRYTVLMSPKKDETAVHCCDPALSVLVTLISGNVFHVASALKSISCLELANQRVRHSGYKHMLCNNNNNNNNNLFLLFLRSRERKSNPVMEGNRTPIWPQIGGE